MRPNRFTRPAAWMPAAFFAILLAAACQEPPRPGAVAPPANATTDEDGRLLPEGLGPLADQIVEAMGTRAEREARAPYSPPDWPYERGESVPMEQALTLRHWKGVEAPFWVGKRVFGARWKYGEGVLLGYEYLGHFPQRTVQALWFQSDYQYGEYGWELDGGLPDHLADVNPAELQDFLFDTLLAGIPGGFVRARYVGLDTLLLHWTEERWLDGYTGPEGGNVPGS